MSPTATTTAKHVALTGASGFVGAHVLREALASGYQVRSIVRSESKGKELQRLFPSPRHTLAYVTDIRNADELREAFRGIDVVQHVASPYTLKFQDAERDMLQPAIDGTLAVLKAAHDTPSIKHVLITSSFAAQNCYEKGGSIRDYTYTEKDWNPASYEDAKKSDNKVYTYAASKGLAEKAAWEFVESAKPQFVLTTFMPPGIIGPIVHPVAKMEDLNTSCANVWSVVSGAAGGVPPTLLPQTVDVRDVAKAHVEAMSHPEKSANQRFSLCGYYMDWQLVVDFLKSRFPEHASTLPTGTPGTPNQPGPVAKLDSAKAKNLLGIEWTPWQDTFADLTSQLYQLQENVKAGKSAL
ncbi:NAD(P)-binding protein [Ceraceosorus guamensis]|uniref:NAD(P)-binding protein n=1 Tax=Ceraceosorus guamensis TaxID=1522189 RepID=A0A316VRZ4_9BASI|nr:NAD(P)-binding protein [Ceraceosorus guamensis]PWN39818.1 NAD(P)-binding protein [Ceraceosorus guamensis]